MTNGRTHSFASASDVATTTQHAFTFYVGVSNAAWIARTTAPIMVSHTRLRHVRRRLPAGRGPVVIDSGAFTELSQHGRFLTSPAEYVDAVDRYRAEGGTVAWAAPQDWMCEDEIVARTGLSVEEHQHRTVEGFCQLDALRPGVFIPVLQSRSVWKYEHCIELYQRAGIDLWARPVVGVGTLCRRSSTMHVYILLSQLARLGLRLHGFGVKSAGLVAAATSLVSADSAAWSLRARFDPSAFGRNGRNDLKTALRWSGVLAARIAREHPHVSVAAAEDDSLIPPPPDPQLRLPITANEREAA
jgi:hypothetical protein